MFLCDKLINGGILFDDGDGNMFFIGKLQAVMTEYFIDIVDETDIHF